MADRALRFVAGAGCFATAIHLMGRYDMPILVTLLVVLLCSAGVATTPGPVRS